MLLQPLPVMVMAARLLAATTALAAGAATVADATASLSPATPSMKTGVDPISSAFYLEPDRQAVAEEDPAEPAPTDAEQAARFPAGPRAPRWTQVVAGGIVGLDVCWLVQKLMQIPQLLAGMQLHPGGGAEEQSTLVKARWRPISKVGAVGAAVGLLAAACAQRSARRRRRSHTTVRSTMLRTPSPMAGECLTDTGPTNSTCPTAPLSPMSGSEFVQDHVLDTSSLQRQLERELTTQPELRLLQKLQEGEEEECRGVDEVEEDWLARRKRFDGKVKGRVFEIEHNVVFQKLATEEVAGVDDRDPLDRPLGELGFKTDFYRIGTPVESSPAQGPSREH